MSKTVEGGIPISSGSAGPDAKVKVDLGATPNPKPEEWSDMNFDSIAPPKHTDDTGKDTYVGIPGDGIVPGR